MKKTFTLLRVLAVSLFALFSVDFANATVCGSAINIPSVPVTSQALVCGAGNDLSATTVPTACGGASNDYKGGNEALYTFTPATTGTYTVSIAGQTWTGIFVYAGCPSSGGTCIGSVGSSTSSKSINVSLTAGTTYYIWFDTWPTPASPCAGTFSLVLAPPPPANDNCAGATAFPSIPTNGTCASVTTNTANATQSLAACAGSGADDDVWYSFVQPTGFTTLNFAHTNISGNADRVTQFFSACGGTSLLCSDPESGTVTGLTAGNTYYVRVHTYGTGTTTSSTLCLSVPPPPPANNDCAGATAFPAIPTNGTCANLTLNTAGASQSLAACAGSGADDDVWFSFVQPAGNTTINFTNTTVSGNTDRVIQFFSACGGTSLLCSDPETGTVTGLTPGVTYYGRIHTYGTGTSTNVTVCLSVPPPPPANDDCSNAITLGAACAGSPVAGSTLLSTVDAIYSNCGAGGSNTTERGVWYKYVGDNNNVTINTCNATGYDSRITVYSGTCGALTCVTGNDDMGAAACSASFNRSQVSFDAFSGTDYYVFIHGYQLNPSLSATGNFILSISCTALCTPIVTNSTCATAIGQSVPTSCSSFTVNNNCAGTALSEPPGAPLFGTYPNLWYSFVAPATDVNIRATLSGTATNVGFVVYPSCGGTNVGFVYPAASGTSYVFSGLTTGNTYYVQVYTPIANKGTFDLCLFYELCPTPLTLTATGITSSQANLGWSSAGTLFDVELGTSGFTPTGTPTTSGVANPFTQTGLSPVTTYTYYVRRDCGAGVYSTWNGPFNFTTLALPPANDDCASAIAFPTIPPTGACASVTVNNAAATQSLAGCIGTADDDMWYSFTVPAGKTSVNYSTTDISGSGDRVFQLFDACAGTSLFCNDAESGTFTGLIGGNTYILRTYSYFASSATNFSLCLSVTPPPPANDDCATAKGLTTCGAQDSIKFLTGATQSLAAGSCGGTAGDDVWYSFVADATTMYATVKGFGGYDAVMELRSGACNGTELFCADNGLADDFEDITATGLTVGQTYYIRVFDYYSSAPSSTMGFWIQVGPGGCWQGSVSSAWNDANNWSNLSVPNSCASNVTIPAGTPNAPAITTATFTVGNVNIASGVNLTLTGNNLNVCGNWAAGTGSNAVTVGTGRVVLQGTAAQTITGNTKFESLTVNSVGGSYTNTGTVQIASRYTPQAGTLTNSGTLRFLSTSATNVATIDLAPANTGTISGTIIAERFVPVAGTNQHYVSSPVDAPSLAGQFGASGTAGYVIPTSNCDETQLDWTSPYGTVFQYVESHGNGCSLRGWEVLTSGNADNSRGYSVYLPGTTTTPWSLSGNANMGSTYSLSGLTNSNWTNTTLQGRTQNSGWSLVGNPYLSTLNLASHSGFDAQAQVWQTSGPYVGTYQAQLMGSGSAFVAPFQGFMVHKTTTGGSATFTFGRGECTNSTSTFYKTGNSNGTLSLKVSGNGYNDITTVTFDDKATNQFDVDLDANKLPGRLVQPMIASKIGNDEYSINSLQSIATNPKVDVEFMAGTNGSFTITADDLSTFDPTVMVYLEDKVTNTPWVDLRISNTYTFTGNVADTKDRFAVHFTPAAFVSVKDAECENGGEITMEQEGDVRWTVEVKNSTTKAVVAKSQPFSATNAVTLNNYPVGTYDIEFTNSNGYVATKTVTIGGTNALVAHYTLSTNTPTVNQSVAFNSTINQAATLSWNFGDGSTSTVVNPNHVYTNPGTYTVVLKATNNDGCEVTVAQTVTVADVTGIGNMNASGKEVSVYVNSEKNLNITFSGYKSEVANIQVFNIIGQEIINAKHNTGTKFVQEISQVEAAYLIVKVTIAGQTTTKKVLITKE